MKRVEDQIQELMKTENLDRKEAAVEILSQYERWYVQTPEGEYLTAVIRGEL